MTRAVVAAGTFVAVMALIWPVEAVVGPTPPAGIAQPHRSRPLRPRPARSRLARSVHRRWPRRPAIGAALALGAIALWWSVPLALLGLAAVPIQRWAVARRAVARRRRALEDAVPESLDLCAVVLGAGGTIRDCVDALAGQGPAAVRPVVAGVAQQADGTERLRGCLRRLQAELGPPSSRSPARCSWPPSRAARSGPCSPA